MPAVTGNGSKVFVVVLGKGGATTSALPDAVHRFAGYMPFGEGVTGRDDGVSALVTLHMNAGPELARSLDYGKLLDVSTVEAYLVEERRQWDEYPAPPVNRISFVHRNEQLTREEFAAHWSDVHTPLAREHHPGVCRYIQNVVIEPLTANASDIDGIAELSFRSESDLRERMYDSPEGKEIISADVRTFLDAPKGWRMLAREIVLRGPRGLLA